MGDGISVIEVANLKNVEVNPGIILVKPEDVETLLLPRPEWGNRLQEWHPDLFQRLASVDSSYARQVKPRKDVYKSLKIKMINTTATIDPSGGLNYDALSYSWHRSWWEVAPQLTRPSSPSALDSTQEVNVARNPISLEMWQMILFESTAKDNLLWVDQVCINQQDRDEKMVTVGFSDRVYQNCDRVLIILEDISIPIDVVESLVALLAGNLENRDSLSPLLKHHAYSFAITLFSARVFSRSWCWHEFSCSDRHLIFIPIATAAPGAGAKLLRLEARRLPEILTLVAFIIRDSSSQQMTNFIPDHLKITAALRAGMKLMKGWMNPTFSEAFRNVFDSSAKLRSDQMTITLNSCNAGLLFIGPEPKDEDQCYRILNSIALAAGDVTTLCATGEHVQNEDGSWSTWLMKPRSMEGFPGFAFMSKHPAPIDVHLSDNGSLLINVIQVGMVRDIEFPSFRLLDVAYAFMHLDFAPLGLHNPFVLEVEVHKEIYSDWQKSEQRVQHINQKFFYAQALAVLLAYGNVEFWDVLADEHLLSKATQNIAGNQRFHTVLEWLRSYSGTAHVQHLTSSKPVSITDGDIKVVAEFLRIFVVSILGVERLDIGGQYSWASYTVGLLRSEKLLNVGVPVAVPRLFPEAIITIVADLASADFSLLRRMWFLQPIPSLHDNHTGVSEDESPPRSYELVSKAKLVGYQAISPINVTKVLIK